jgi:beta-lactamase regulating signal transducer with metallopeptidase domain/uncharacterized GH25 family protein
MNVTVTLLPVGFTERLALTLVHFLWQGALVALAAAMLEGIVRLRMPSSRYALNVAALFALAACPLVTFAWLGEGGPVAIAPEQIAEYASQVAPADLEIGGNNRQIHVSEGLVGVSTTPTIGQSWMDWGKYWIVLCWSAGVGILACRLLLGWVWLQRLERGYERVPEAVLQQAQRLCAQLKLRVPPIYASRRVVEAIAFGLFRPTILLPLSWLTELTPEMLEAILAHELAHLVRWDLWIMMVQRVVEMLLFYHPAVWWVSRRLRLEREFCCDEIAVALTQNRLGYARTLEQVGRLTLAPTNSNLAVAVGGSQMNLLRRVQLVLNQNPARASNLHWLLPVLVLALLLGAWRVCLYAPAPVLNAAEIDGSASAPASDVTITVVDTDDKPVPGAELRIFLSHYRKEEKLRRTDAKGEVQLPASWMSAEAGSVFVVADNERLGWCGPAWKIQGKEPRNRIRLLPLTHTLRGRLTDSDGKPLVNVNILVTQMYEESNLSISFYETAFTVAHLNATTNADGEYVIRVPEGTSGWLKPRHDDWMPKTIRWKADQTNLGTVSLGQGGRIEGRIVESRTGQPVAGAFVGAQAYVPDTDTGGYGASKSDEAGNYRIGGLKPGAYNVLFTAPGDREKLVAPAIESVQVETLKPAHANLQASEGKLVTGKVVESQTGRALARTHVGYYGTARPRSGAACLMVLTDEAGSFQFIVPPGDSYFYVADGRRQSSADSTSTIEVPGDRDPQPITLKAGPPWDETGVRRSYGKDRVKEILSDPAYRLKGALHAKDSRPVTKVELRMVYSGNNRTYMHMSVSGASFDHQFWKHDAGRKAYFLVDAVGFAPTRSPELVIQQSIEPMTIELTPAVYVPVRGRVLDLTGTPVGGARVRAGSILIGNEKQFPVGVEATTDENGRFELRRLRQGERIYVSVDKAGTSGAESSAITVDKPTPVDLPDMRVGPPDQVLRGQVIDNLDGHPVPGVKLIVAGKATQETTTDKDGRFEFSHLPTGDFELTPSAAGYRSWQHRCRAGQTNMVVDLYPLPLPNKDDYEVKVDLRSRDGKPVANCKFWLLNPKDNQPIWSTSFTGNRYQANLADDWRRIHSARFALILAPEGYVQPAPVWFDVRKDLPPLVVDLEPAAPVRMRGRVVNEQGAPVIGANVGFSRTLLGNTADEPWRWLDHGEKTPVTDKDGRFEISGLQPGSKVAVYINAPGCAGVRSPSIAVLKEKNVELPEMLLKKSKRDLVGKVLNDKSEPVAGASVRIFDFDHAETTTDSEGRFLLRGVPETETFAVVASAPEYERNFREVKSGDKEVTIQFTND